MLMRFSYLNLNGGRLEMAIGRILRLAHDGRVVVMALRSHFQRGLGHEATSVGGHRFLGVAHAGGDAVALAVDPCQLIWLNSAD